MIARSEWVFDRKYYAQFYSDWLRTRSRFRKLAVPVGLLIVVTGVALPAMIDSHRLLGIEPLTQNS